MAMPDDHVWSETFGAGIRTFVLTLVRVGHGDRVDLQRLRKAASCSRRTCWQERPLPCLQDHLHCRRSANACRSPPTAGVAISARPPQPVSRTSANVSAFDIAFFVACAAARNGRARAIGARAERAWADVRRIRLVAPRGTAMDVPQRERNDLWAGESRGAQSLDE